MDKGIFITGTGTDVGKTMISAGMLYIIKKYIKNVCYFKPLSSGGVEQGQNIKSPDLIFIRNFINIMEDDQVINPYSFKEPASPHLASKIENVEIDINNILNNYYRLKNKYDYTIVEGCGGIAVPINNSVMQIELIKEMNLGCVIVSNCSLGTINHTLLTVEYIKSYNIEIKGIIFNNYSGNIIEDDNIDFITKKTCLPVVALFNKMILNESESTNIINLKKLFEKNFLFEQFNKIL